MEPRLRGDAQPFTVLRPIRFRAEALQASEEKLAFSPSITNCAASAASSTPSRRVMIASPLPPISRISGPAASRSEEHTSELQSLMRNSYAVFCLKKKKKKQPQYCKTDKK